MTTGFPEMGIAERRIMRYIDERAMANPKVRIIALNKQDYAIAKEYSDRVQKWRELNGGNEYVHRMAYDAKTDIYFDAGGRYIKIVELPYAHGVGPRFNYEDDSVEEHDTVDEEPLVKLREDWKERVHANCKHDLGTQIIERVSEEQRKMAPQGFRSPRNRKGHATTYIITDANGVILDVRSNVGTAFEIAFTNPNASRVEFWDAVDGVKMGAVNKDGSEVSE